MIALLLTAQDNSPKLTDWLTGIGGVGAFLAAIALAVLAFRQIRAGQAQAQEAKQQSEAALTIAREQSAASVAIARETREAAHETREAAQRQWQPRVIPYRWGDPKPGTGDDAAPDEMAVGYRLKNEGTGPAFNVEHGVEVGGRAHRWPAGQYPAMRSGEELPPMLDATGQPVQLNPLVVGVNKGQWTDDIVYWTRFENLLGERFEVRNPPDDTKPAKVRRVFDG
jgi:hypothetical protein